MEDNMKGERERQRYLQAREAVKPKAFWETHDAWPLYAGAKNIKRYLYIASLLQRVRNVPGDVAEFGCWKGATTSFMAKVLSDTTKRILAFDTFEGFDAQIQKEKDLRSGYKGSLEELKMMLEVDGLLDSVVFHVGDICKTVPALHAEHVDTPLSLVMIDCDVYEPSIVALRWAHMNLCPGGLIVFDEYGDEAWPGETRAAHELLAEHGSEYTREATCVQQPSLVLVRK